MSDYMTSRGEFSLQLATGEPRRLRVDLRAGGGVDLFVGDDFDSAELIFSGSGVARVVAPVQGDTLFVVPHMPNTFVSVSVPELRDATSDTGWTLEPSLTDLEPKERRALSPEIRAVMDQMNRNAIAREQALLKSLGRR